MTQSDPLATFDRARPFTYSMSVPPSCQSCQEAVREQFERVCDRLKGLVPPERLQFERNVPADVGKPEILTVRYSPHEPLSRGAADAASANR